MSEREADRDRGADRSSGAGESLPQRRSAQLVPFPGLLAVPSLARFSLRGELSALAGALVSSGVPISRQPCRAVEGENSVALWLGPDEQLLLASEADGAQLVQILREELTAIPHSLVDIGHRQTAFEVAGQHAKTMLNTGCPLDLGDAAFPVGMCTRTLFEKCEIVLWRQADAKFHVEVARSLAPHVTGLLAKAAHELGG